MLWALFSILLLLSPARAQFDGTWHLNVTTRDSGAPGAGCIILAQIATLSAPDTITAMKPICPPTAPNPSADGGEAVSWPLSEDGDGALSSLVVYGDLPGGDGDPMRPGCVMFLEQMQVAYLLGRDLQWISTLGEMYDLTSKGSLRDPKSYGNMVCHHQHPYLNDALALPNPNKHKKEESIWWQAVTVPGLGQGEWPAAPNPTTSFPSEAATSGAGSSSSSESATTTSFRFINTGDSETTLPVETVTPSSAPDLNVQESTPTPEPSPIQITKEPMPSPETGNTTVPIASSNATVGPDSPVNATGAEPGPTSTSTNETVLSGEGLPLVTLAPSLVPSFNGSDGTATPTAVLVESTQTFSANETTTVLSELSARPSSAMSLLVEATSSSNVSSVATTGQSSVITETTGVAVPVVSVNATQPAAVVVSTPNITASPVQGAMVSPNDTTVTPSSSTNATVYTTTGIAIIETGGQPTFGPPTPSVGDVNATAAETPGLPSPSSANAVRPIGEQTNNTTLLAGASSLPDASANPSILTSSLSNKTSEKATQIPVGETTNASPTRAVVTLSTVQKGKTTLGATTIPVGSGETASPAVQPDPTEPVDQTDDGIPTSFAEVTAHLPHNVTAVIHPGSKNVTPSNRTSVIPVMTTSQNATTTSIVHSRPATDAMPTRSPVPVAPLPTSSPEYVYTSDQTSDKPMITIPLAVESNATTSTTPIVTPSPTQHLCCENVISVEDRALTTLTITTTVTCTPCSHSTATSTRTISIPQAQTTQNNEASGLEADSALAHTGQNEEAVIVTIESGATSTPSPTPTLSPESTPAIASTSPTASSGAGDTTTAQPVKPAPASTPSPLDAPTFDDDASPFREMGFFPFSISLKLNQRQRGSGMRGGARHGGYQGGYGGGEGEYRGGGPPAYGDYGDDIAEPVAEIDYEALEQDSPAGDAGDTLDNGSEVVAAQDQTVEGSTGESSAASLAPATRASGVATNPAPTRAPASTAQRETVPSPTRTRAVISISSVTGRLAGTAGRLTTTSSIGFVNAADNTSRVNGSSNRSEGSDSSIGGAGPSNGTAASDREASEVKSTPSLTRISSSASEISAVSMVMNSSDTTALESASTYGVKETGQQDNSSISIVEPSSNIPAPKMEEPTSTTSTTETKTATDSSTTITPTTLPTPSTSTAQPTSTSTSSEPMTTSTSSTPTSTPTSSSSNSSSASISEPATSTPNTTAQTKTTITSPATTAQPEPTTSSPASSNEQTSYVPTMPAQSSPSEQSSPTSSSPSTSQAITTEQLPAPPSPTQEPPQPTEQPSSPSPSPDQTPAPSPSPEPSPEPSPVPSPEPSPESSPEPSPEPSSESPAEPSPEPAPSDPVFTDAGITIGQFVTSLLSSTADSPPPQPDAPQEQQQGGSDVTVIGQFTPTGDIPGLAQATQTLALMFHKDTASGNELESGTGSGSVDADQVVNVMADLLGAPTFSAVNMVVDVPVPTATTLGGEQARGASEAMVHAISPTAQPVMPQRRRSRSRRRNTRRA